MTIKVALLVLSAGSLAAAACGSDGAAPACGLGQACGQDGGNDAGDAGPPVATCGNVQPCGGDVVGDWMFVEECESAASIAASQANFSKMAATSWCVSQTLAGIEPQAAGSLVLDAAGTYSLALMFGGYLDVNYPAECLAGASCADATAGFQSQIAEGTFSMPNVSSVSCTGASNCLCREAVEVLRAETGTYSVSGSVLTFNAASGAVTNKSYCVVGRTLHIVDTSTASTGQTDIDSDLVATKQ